MTDSASGTGKNRKVGNVVKGYPFNRLKGLDLEHGTSRRVSKVAHISFQGNVGIESAGKGLGSNESTKNVRKLSSDKVKAKRAQKAIRVKGEKVNMVLVQDVNLDRV